MNAPLNLKDLLRLREIETAAAAMQKKQMLANKAAAARILLQIKAQLDANDARVTITPREIT